MAVITRWDPFRVLSRIDEEFEDLFRRSALQPSSSAMWGYVPACDVSAEGTDVVVTLELPGIDPATDVDVRVDRGRLMITGERQETSEHDGHEGRMLVRELRYGSFRREFALPDSVTPGDIDASYDAGLLRVRIRDVRRPEAEPARIDVRVIEGGDGEASAT